MPAGRKQQRPRVVSNSNNNNNYNDDNFIISSIMSVICNRDPRDECKTIEFDHDITILEQYQSNAFTMLKLEKKPIIVRDPSEYKFRVVLRQSKVV